MGGYETGTLVLVEPSLKYHPGVVEVLTQARESGPGTVHGRQFDWGGLLPKVTEEYEGLLGTVGHRTDSAMAKEV